MGAAEEEATKVKAEKVHESITKEESDVASKPKKMRASELMGISDKEYRKLSHAQQRNLRKKAKNKRLSSTSTVATDGATEESAGVDPSLKFIRNPMKAPIIHDARRYFKDLKDGNRIKELDVTLGEVTGWRTQAKLAARQTPVGLKLGIFAEGTRTVIDSDTNPVHHPAINAAISKVQAAARTVALQGYNDEAGAGDLRYVQFTAERATSKVQLVLVWHAKKLKDAKDAGLDDFLKAIGDDFHSVYVNLHIPWKHSNRIFSFENEDWIHVQGSPNPLEEKLTTLLKDEGHEIVKSKSDKNNGNFDIQPLQAVARDAKDAKKTVAKRPAFAPADGTSLAIAEHRLPTLHFAPNTFLQSNLTGFENIVKSIRAFVPNDARVLELYGGVGTIGLHLADKVAEIDCSDENPNNQEMFNKSRKMLTKKQQKVVKPYTVANGEAKAAEIEQYDTIIVDPPRKGLCAGVKEALINTAGPRRLVYVSCGFSSFKQDCTALLEAGWKLIHAEGHILFPGADHLETVSFFARDLEITKPGKPKSTHPKALAQQKQKLDNKNKSGDKNLAKGKGKGESQSKKRKNREEEPAQQVEKKSKKQKKSEEAEEDPEEEAIIQKFAGIVPDFDDEDSD